MLINNNNINFNMDFRCAKAISTPGYGLILGFSAKTQKFLAKIIGLNNKNPKNGHHIAIYNLV